MSVPAIHPFPGLRTFRPDEDYLFFGREDQTIELLTRLGKQRFLAVVGTSGSGKSSLVRCGLLSELQGGKMLQAGTRWEVAVTHPGGDPLNLLAEALFDSGLYDRSDEDAHARLLATLSRSHFGLVEAVRQAKLPEGTNTLLVIDQFEEIFRFHEAGHEERESATEFVNTLLTAAAQRELPIYIILTMRSDFIGDCAQFEGLAEAVNQGEFLIPRLTREQYKLAIEGPVRVAGAAMAPRLLQRLLNDLGEQGDQLPCLQHALMRTWDHWLRMGQQKRDLDLEDYTAIGRMGEALARHADEIYEALPDDRARDLGTRLFKALTIQESENRGVRRPQRLGRLCQILGVTAAEIVPIIDAYRAPGVTFLLPSPGVTLSDATIIDISHESLMRVWVRLRHWVEEEAQSAGIFKRLTESAALFEKKQAGLYRDPELGIARSWRNEVRPNSAWAHQYGGGFEAAMDFLDRSQATVDREEAEREAARQRELQQTRQLAETQSNAARLFKRFAASLAVGLCLAVALTIWAFRLRQEANEMRTLAESEAQKTQAALVASNHEQGKGLLVMATGRLEQDDVFASKILAASAIGFKGFGRETKDAAFAASHPDLLQPQSEERRAVENLLRGEPDFMRLWVSPSVAHHPNRIVGLAVTPDGRRLISAGSDGTIHVWDIPSGESLRSFRLKDTESVGLTAVQQSLDGRWLATVHSDGTVRIHDTGTWEELHRLSTPGAEVNKIRLSPDGKTLVCASNDGGIKAWGTTGMIERPPFERAPASSSAVRSLEFHPQGRFLLATLYGSGGPPRVWDLETGKLTQPPLEVIAERTAAFSPDGRWLALVRKADNIYTLSLLRWEMEGGVPRATSVATQTVAAYGFLTFSADSQTLLSAGNTGPISSYSVPDLRAGSSMPGSPRGNDRTPFTTVGRSFFYVSGGSSDSIRSFELPSGQPKWVPDGHVDMPTRVVFSPNGRLFASAGRDGDVRIWETATGRTRSVLRGHEGEVNDVLFRPDGVLLASASTDRTIRLWDVATGAERQVLRGHESEVLCLSVHPGGQGFASGGGDGTVRFWSWEGNDGKETGNLEGPGKGVNNGRWKPVKALAFSPDGRQLAFTQGNGIELWDWSQQKAMQPPLKGHTADVDSIAFSPDGALLASGGRLQSHGETRLWDLRSGASLQRWYEDNIFEGSRVAFTADGRHFVRGLSNRVEWYEIGREQGNTIRQVAVLDKRVQDPMEEIASSPDGRLLLTAHSWTGLELWDVSRGKEELEWSNPDGDEFSAWGTDLSPDGRLLATGTRNGSIRIWDPANGRLLHSFKADNTLRTNFEVNVQLLNASATPKDAVTGVRFSPDGQRLYSVYDRSGLITIWELKDRWREGASVANGQPVLRLALSADGTLLAAASYDAVRVWDARTLGAAPLAKIDFGGGWPWGTHLAFHSTRPLLAVSGNGIRAFDLTDPRAPRPVQHIPGNFKSLTYSPDGKFLSGANQFGPERIFDAETGKLVRSSRGPTDRTRWASVFSPDGRWLAVGSEEKMVRIWEVETGELAAVLRGHADWVNHVQFTPDGRRLVTVCSQTVRVWDVERALHGSTDYASQLEDFRIEGDRVKSIAAENERSHSENLYRSLTHSFRPSSSRSILSILQETKDAGEQARQLFWQYYRAQNLASARAVLSELEAAGQSGSEREALADLYHLAARGDLENLNPRLALQRIDVSIDLEPGDSEAWKLKAEILLQAGDYPNALAAVDRAIELSPQAAASWALKAQLLGKGSNPDISSAGPSLEEAADEAWKKAIELAPEQQKETYLAMSQAGKPTPRTPDEHGWVRLFDGKTLSGWTSPTASRWLIKDGDLTGAGTKSMLYSPYKYANLEFRSEVKVATAGNGGMYFRSAFATGWFVGYEAQVCNTQQGEPQKTGSLYNFHPVTEPLVQDDAWFTLHIVAIGNRILIKVNDTIVTDFVDEKNTYTSGCLALQQFGAAPTVTGPVVTYRNVMVKPLSDDTAAAWAEARKDVPDAK